MTISNEVASDSTSDNNFREATNHINATIRAIHDTLENLEHSREMYILLEDIPVFLSQLHSQLVEYKMLHNRLIVNNEEDISDYACAKDTIAAFNKSLDQVLEQIKELKDYILVTHFPSTWSNSELDFINNEMEKITQKLKSLENTRSEVTFCAYYNDIGAID